MVGLEQRPARRGKPPGRPQRVDALHVAEGLLQRLRRHDGLRRRQHDSTSCSSAAPRPNPVPFAIVAGRAPSFGRAGSLLLRGRPERADLHAQAAHGHACSSTSGTATASRARCSPRATSPSTSAASSSGRPPRPRRRRRRPPPSCRSRARSPSPRSRDFANGDTVVLEPAGGLGVREYVQVAPNEGRRRDRGGGRHHRRAQLQDPAALRPRERDGHQGDARVQAGGGLQRLHPQPGDRHAHLGGGLHGPRGRHDATAPTRGSATAATSPTRSRPTTSRRPTTPPPSGRSRATGRASRTRTAPTRPTCGSTRTSTWGSRTSCRRYRSTSNAGTKDFLFGAAYDDRARARSSRRTRTATPATTTCSSTAAAAAASTPA